MSSAAPLVQPRPDKLLRFGLWLAQSAVFLGFVAIGLIKLLKPIPELAAMWPWTGELPMWVVRSLGVVDIAGGVGVLMPALTRIRPNLTVTAALCCVLLQICAAGFHLARGEIAATPVNMVFLALSAFIFWGRRRAPIEPR